MSAELVDTLHPAGWELYAVQFSGKPENTRLFFDRVTGKAWPLAIANCKGFEKAGR